MTEEQEEAFVELCYAILPGHDYQPPDGAVAPDGEFVSISYGAALLLVSALSKLSKHTDWTRT